jgi:putative tricarboxylic transport membrane protein
MQTRSLRRFLRPESLTAAATFLVSAAFLIPAIQLSPISALLPLAMLGSLMVLAVAMLIVDQRKASQGVAAERMTRAPGRVMAAFVMIVLYACAVEVIGFYPSTAVAVPLVAHAFGYRNVPRLALATLVVMAAIYLIFGFAMSEQFPAGLLWSK